MSNRLPVSVSRRGRHLEQRRAPGGLVSALEPALRRWGGRWIGWPGIELRPGEQISSGDAAYEVHSVNISEAEIDGYYHGFSNGTLWPLFHCFPGRAHFEPNEWAMYEQINTRFANAAAACAGRSDLIWVHDYQLMLVPSRLRAAHAQARIAFFLHVPFPPYDLFRLLPWDGELLRGLLAADLVGFHVDTYVRNFLDCSERILGARVDREARLIEHGDRTVRVGAFPIGIDFEFFESRARAAPAPERSPRERVVLGVDRLDYTKGLPERILAVERLLELYPQHREEITFLQIAVPSRVQVAEYNKQKRQIDELVGRVNGRFATAEWSPIRYLYRNLSPEELAALYRDADVAVVTPLRDGMNLVAKEFVACQVDGPGVLVLSHLAGAAETMREAILVNPYHLDATAEALHRALTMDETERRSRMAALRWRERHSQVSTWLDEFLQAAATPGVLQPASDRDFEAWLEPMLAGYRIALFLDYDGTLAALRDDPQAALPTAAMRQALDACVQRSDVDVAIISGRALDNLRAMVDRAGIVYAANHGLEITGPGIPAFRHADLVHFEARLAEVATALDAIATDGAWVERKVATLTFHYRTVAAVHQERLAEQARSLIMSAGFQARDAHCAVEARPPIAWDKGLAVYHILRGRYGPTWSETVRVVYAGDDQTDEDAFRILAGLGVTFRVGSADTPTVAMRRLANVDAVRALLTWLAARATAA